MIGDGPLRAQAQAILNTAGVAHLAWLPGERGDIPDIMRGLQAFVLPSLAEGISNTILEAMARCLVGFASDPERARLMGLAGRQRAIEAFSMQSMVDTYQTVYDRQLQRLRTLHPTH